VTLIKGSIGLGIRERHPHTDISEYSADSIRLWIADLPMANIGEVSRRVYHRLLDSNSQLLDIRARSRVLHSLHDSIKFVSNHLTRHYTVQSASLTEKQMKVANLSRAIQLEVAIGYKTIIEDLLSDEKYGNKLLPIAVNYALYYLYKVLVLTNQLYSDLPAGLWHEIHLLYQLAEQNQFHERKIAVGNEQHNAVNTYKKAVLLAMSNPNQLRQRDMDLVAKSLPVIVKNCSISADPDAVYDFVTNLHTDAPPFHRSLIKDGMKAHFRGFNVTNIIIFLQQELKTSEKKRRKVALSDTIIRHLLRAWGAMATRTFARTPASDSIQVSMGLAASHYLISREMYGEYQDEEDRVLMGEQLVNSLEGSLKNATILDDKDTEMYQGPKTRRSEWNVNTNGPMIKTDSVWDSVYRKKSSLNIEDDRKPYQFMNKDPESKATQYKFQDAAIINVSPGGYCMKLMGKMPRQTQTGEVIGLLENHESGKSSWNIGHICWIKRMNNGELHLGVNLLAPNAEPVLAQNRATSASKKNYQRSLLLPPVNGLGQISTILTSTIGFSANEIVRIQENENEFDIKLIKLIASGHSFLQFTYEKLHTETQEETIDDSDDNFDSVWDIL